MITQSFLQKNLLKHYQKALNNFFIPIQGRIKEILFTNSFFFVFLIYRSEANDLALRLARQFTGNFDILVLDK
jgi:4-aminobutyrate aminotransferase-like enzyme